MCYRDSSNRSGDLSEAIAELEMIKRGWIVSEPVSRDAAYDRIVDLGDNTFNTVQIKTMCGNSIVKVVDRSGEIVSKNGKTRDSIDYAEHGIDWLVGVNKEGKCFFYKHETYSKIPSKSFSTKKYPPDNFPQRTVPNTHAAKPKEITRWTTQN